jgi:hypothetical protein
VKPETYSAMRDALRQELEALQPKHFKKSTDDR